MYMYTFMCILLSGYIYMYMCLCMHVYVLHTPLHTLYMCILLHYTVFTVQTFIVYVTPCTCINVLHMYSTYSCTCTCLQCIYLWRIDNIYQSVDNVRQHKIGLARKVKVRFQGWAPLINHTLHCN